MPNNIATELFNVAATELTKKIKSGTFVAADIKAAAELIKISGTEISLDNSKPAKDLKIALNDSDTGGVIDFANPPEFKIVREQ